MRAKDPMKELEEAALKHAAKMSAKMTEDAEILRKMIAAKEEADRTASWLSTRVYGGGGTPKMIMPTVAIRPPDSFIPTGHIIPKYLRDPEEYVWSDVPVAEHNGADGATFSSLGKNTTLLTSNHEAYSAAHGNQFGIYLSKDGRWAVSTALIVEEDFSVTGASLAGKGKATPNTLVVVTDLCGTLTQEELTGALQQAGVVVQIPTEGNKDRLKGKDWNGYGYVGWLFPMRDEEGNLATMVESDLYRMRSGSRRAFNALLEKPHSFLSKSVVEAAKELQEVKYSD